MQALLVFMSAGTGNAQPALAGGSDQQLHLIEEGEGICGARDAEPSQKGFGNFGKRRRLAEPTIKIFPTRLTRRLTVVFHVALQSLLEVPVLSHMYR